MDVNMLLAGDIGGTKTLLGLFESRAVRAPARRSLVRAFTTLDYPDLSTIIADVRRGRARRVRRRDRRRPCFGVAGPVARRRRRS